MPNTKAPSNYSHGGDIWNHPAAVDFSANLHPLGMPPEVAEALRASVEEAVNYPDPFCTQLRRAIAHGQGVEAEEVICGAGAADLIYRLCLTLRPQNALVTAPTFSVYAQALALTGCTPRRFLLHPENQFDLGEDFLNALTPELNMVFLCTPNNPTGRCVPLPLLRRIADRCEDIGAHLVLDECFIRLTDCPSALELLRDRPHLFLLRAFTKTYAIPGLRLGYGLSIDGGLLSALYDAGPPWAVSTAALTAGLAACTCPHWAEQGRALLREERPRLVRALRALGLTVWEGEANYLLFRAGCTDLRERLLKKDILIRACAGYAGLGPDYYRVCVRTGRENERLLYALKEVL